MSNMMEMVPMAQVREALLTGKLPEVVDTDQVADMIAQRLWMTDDIDELLNVEGRDNTEKILDVPFTLRGAIFMPSDVEDAKVPVFAVMDMVDDDGNPKVMTCGARNLLIQLVKLIDAGALPRRVKLIEVGRAKPNRSRPIYLTDARKMTVSELKAKEGRK
jgi:hypothetical protein